MKFDDLIVGYLGEFGTYQKLQFFAVCLPTIVTAMHAFTWTFAAIDIPNRCRLPAEVDVNSTTYWLPGGVSRHLKLNTKNCFDDDVSNQRKCFYKECSFDDLDSCPYGLVFDTSKVSLSATNRWEIACDRQVLKASIQSSYYVGQMVGSLVFGFLGDRIGRKMVFFIALLLQISTGLLMIFAPHWAMYGILRAFVGASHPGVFMIAVIIGMELMGPSKRKIASVMTGIFFSIGQALLGVAAYFLKDDYRYLQAVIAVPSLVFVSYWWIVPESARWLISQQRFAEADAILQRVARANKTQLPEKWWEEIEFSGSAAPSISRNKMADEERQSLHGQQDGAGLSSGDGGGGKSMEFRSQRQHNFFDLLRTSRIRRISLAIFFCWPVVSMIYYGMSMNPTFLGGDLYKNFIFGSLMEIPSVIIVYFLLDKLGRKPILAAGFIIASTCTLSNLIFSGESVHWFVSMGQYLVSKGAITAVYVSIYAFTPELFPTVIRNMAMGVCSMMARIGAISGSYISMWLTKIYGKSVMIIPFAVLGYLAALILIVCLPETMGRELPESIEELEGNTRSYELQPLQTDQGRVLTNSPAAAETPKTR